MWTSVPPPVGLGAGGAWPDFVKEPPGNRTPGGSLISAS